MTTAAHRAAKPPAPPRVLGPVLLIVLGLGAALAFSFGYANWAINNHSRQACAELHVLATAAGAQTPYDRAVKREYKHLVTLRCG